METPDWNTGDTLRSVIDVAKDLGTAIIDRTVDLVMDAAEWYDNRHADRLNDPRDEL